MSDLAIVHTGITEKERIVAALKAEGYSVYEWRDPAGTQYPTHIHPCDEVRWIVEGEMVLGANGQEYRFAPGDRFDVKPDTPHWARTAGGVTYICGSR